MLKRLLHIAAAYRRGCLSLARVKIFMWMERRNLRELVVGLGMSADVPLRSCGTGLLRIGDYNSFGYWPAPRLGSGEILLQPRNKTSEISIGSRNTFSNNVSIVANERIVIGSSCLIGDQVAIVDSDFHEIDPLKRKTSAGPSAPVTIGDNVWLGSRVMILKGVTVGNNSVIGAMSLVNKPIPENCLAAGVPAKVIRSII